jgi:hypothetical protein
MADKGDDMNDQLSILDSNISVLEQKKKATE